MDQLLELKLDAIEAEMKRISFWVENPPDLQAKYASGEMKTYLDAPSFELWLQCVFLPNARRAVQSRTLPRDSHVGVMAMRQYDYHSIVSEALPLVRLLHDFDDAVRAAAR